MNYYEPWDAKQDGGVFSTTDVSGTRVLDDDSFSGAMVDPDVQRRIAACVNACVGMDDPVAEVARLKSWWQKTMTMAPGYSKEEA